MRRLLPSPADDVDLYEAYRPQPGPLLRLNMVLSADGRATDREGRTGALGGTGDKEVFRTLRALADAILVGAGTVRAEGYGPHRLNQRLGKVRAADGRPKPAPIVVISGSGRLDTDTPLFTEADSPTIVVTTERCPTATREAVARRGVLVLAGEREIDVAHAVGLLRSQFGLAHLLCEGGPTLNAALLDAGLVDELCLTLASAIVGVETPALTAPTATGHELTLTHALADDDSGELYLRYKTTLEE